MTDESTMTVNVEHLPIEECAETLNLDLCITFRDTAKYFGEDFCRTFKLSDPNILKNIPMGVNSILMMGRGCPDRR